MNALPQNEHATAAEIEDLFIDLQLRVLEFGTIAGIFFQVLSLQRSGASKYAEVEWTEIGRSGAASLATFFDRIRRLNDTEATTLWSKVNENSRSTALAKMKQEFPGIEPASSLVQRISDSIEGESGNKGQSKADQNRYKIKEQANVVRDELFYTCSCKNQRFSCSISYKKAEVLADIHRLFIDSFYELERSDH